jgi:hypothetical protein
LPEWWPDAHSYGSGKRARKAVDFSETGKLRFQLFHVPVGLRVVFHDEGRHDGFVAGCLTRVMQDYDKFPSAFGQLAAGLKDHSYQWFLKTVPLLDPGSLLHGASAIRACRGCETIT